MDKSKYEGAKMIYWKDENLLIRTILPADARIICDEETAQGWEQTIDKYLARIRDFNSGKCVSLVAEYKGAVAGYINVYPNSAWGSFGGMGYSEIVDFGVLEKYRCNGIGTKLMDVAEKIAAEYSDTVYLGVGLHGGYGSAQRMYIKRGYMPDGRGVWYGDGVAASYQEYRNDDDLNLYLSKKLGQQTSPHKENDMRDCGFTEGNNWFRYRAGAIIIEDGCVLFAGNEREDYLYSIGGGVRMGETAEEAVLREVFEETGVRYEIERLAVIHENFFRAGSGTLKGLNCHEISFFFLMKPRGTQELCSSSYTNGVKEEMHWIPIKELDRYRAFPCFLKEYLSGEHSGIEHIVTDQRES